MISVIFQTTPQILSSYLAMNWFYILLKLAFESLIYLKVENTCILFRNLELQFVQGYVITAAEDPHHTDLTDH